MGKTRQVQVGGRENRPVQERGKGLPHLCSRHGAWTRPSATIKGPGGAAESEAGTTGATVEEVEVEDTEADGVINTRQLTMGGGDGILIPKITVEGVAMVVVVVDVDVVGGTTTMVGEMVDERSVATMVKETDIYHQDQGGRHNMGEHVVRPEAVLPSREALTTSDGPRWRSSRKWRRRGSTGTSSTTSSA
jgi:hypothetical protein